VSIQEDYGQLMTLQRSSLRHLDSDLAKHSRVSKQSTNRELWLTNTISGF
jgi:hypothetical protein